jgi:hypothetical protein
MNRARNIMLIAAIMMTMSVIGLARTDETSAPSSALLIEEYGFRVQPPSEAWTFQQSPAHDVKALLQHSQDPAQLRLQVTENMRAWSDRKVMEEYQKYQKKLDRSLFYDKNIQTTSVNGRNWYVLNGTRSNAPFSIHFNFEKENVFFVTYETPSKELFQKYQADRDAFLSKIEFGAAPVKRFADFDAFEIEVVPVGNTKMDIDDTASLAVDIKQTVPSSVFKEMRPGRTSATSKTLLLTLQVKLFKRGSRAKRYFVGFGTGKSALDGDLIFTDKETGKVVYTAQVSHETTGGIFGGSSFNGVGDQVADIIKRKK